MILNQVCKFLKKNNPQMYTKHMAKYKSVCFNNKVSIGLYVHATRCPVLVLEQHQYILLK